MASKKPHLIFTIGGVLSGLGKGIVSSSVGYLLQSRGYSVTAVKIDPYISIDAGTMRPAEHGEVFVTADGGEIDQDLGNYERFFNLSLSKDNNITTGKVYQEVINKERSFFYEGRDAEFIPDIVNQIKEMIFQTYQDQDFIIVEVGGTTGDFENVGFLYAARELGLEYPAAYILVTYLPFLRNVGELKTKPTQHAVRELRKTGISPDFIITRNEVPIDPPRVETIAKRCFVPEKAVIDNPDADTIYRVPLVLEEAGLAEQILDKFGLDHPKPDIKPWQTFVKNVTTSDKKVRIGLVGKYVTHGHHEHHDVYLSVAEAVRHAAGHLNLKPEIIQISSTDIEENGTTVLDDAKLDAMILPQGWGSRGTEGKIIAANWARETKTPYLGLCFGMQLACVSYARNVCDLKNANSQEIDDKTPHPVIHIMPDQKEYLEKMQYGGTIRLGQWPCLLKPGTLIHQAYTDAAKKYTYDYYQTGDKDLVVQERHRHRYEFNNAYREQLEKAGLIISGTSPDGKLVESIELSTNEHPFYVATQFHPEYQSRVLSPHPIFLKFLESATQ